MKTLFILSAYPCRKQISCIFTFLFGLILFANLTACSEQNDDFSCPEAMDDATLLASQLKLLKTRANNATNTILVTTSTAVSFTVEKNSQIVVDWGDGNSDIDVFSHTYTDNLPVHTITFNGTQDAIQKLNCQKQEIIFLDVTKDTLLTELDCQQNRITTLDLTSNRILQKLQCDFNKLDILNTDNNTQLKEFRCQSNTLRLLDVTHNPLLTILDCSENGVYKLNLSNNTNLIFLYCYGNNIDTLDLGNALNIEIIICNTMPLQEFILAPNNPNLEYVEFYDTPFAMIEDNIFEIVDNLPNRKGLEEGFIIVGNYANIDYEFLQNFAYRKNWLLIP